MQKRKFSPSVPQSPARVYKSSKKQQTNLGSNNDKQFSSSTLGVYVRLRPLKYDKPTITKLDDQQVKTKAPDGGAEVYSFTRVFENAEQSEIFDHVARPMAEEFISKGKDGLIFTYGITGSGKTYTMEGLKSDPGLINRSMDFIFNSIGAHQTPRSQIVKDERKNKFKLRNDQLYPDLDRAETPLVMSPSETKFCQNRSRETASVNVDSSYSYCIFISLVELYGTNKVYDLFETNPNYREKKILYDRQGRGYVADSTEHEVKSADEAIVHYMRGILRRKTCSTVLNENSSRGHCVLNLKLVQLDKAREDLNWSQLCLVDLAGSERTKRSRTEGEANRETCNINKSLDALRRCIRDLRDKQPIATFRDHDILRLFKSYFEGHGSVRMVLCVKPTSDDFYENKIAMEFGVLTRDVHVDYHSPPKMFKRSKSEDLSCDMMYEYMQSRKRPLCEPNSKLTDDEFFTSWIDRLKSNREQRKKWVEVAYRVQREVRDRMDGTIKVNESLKQQYESRIQDIKQQEKEFDLLKSDLNTTNRSKDKLNERVKCLERENRLIRSKEKNTRNVAMQLQVNLAQQEKVHRDIMHLIKTEQNRNDTIKRLEGLLSKTPNEWTAPITPSAPVEHMQSSSPINIPHNQSTSEETTESHTPPTTTNSSTPVMDYQEHRLSTSPIKTMTSPTNRCARPIANPDYDRSSTSKSHLHYKPPGTCDTGTVLKTKVRGKTKSQLKEKDIKRANSVSFLNHDTKPDGGLTTEIWKGNVIPTGCGGTQVIFYDVERMRQDSPIDTNEPIPPTEVKRPRAASDAHFNYHQK